MGAGVNNPLPILSHKQIERLWRYVDVRGPNECWEWMRWKSNGYGRMGIHGVLYLATRLVWFLNTGIDPGKDKVLHTCDNPPCCNPRHLFTGSQADNMADASRKLRVRAKPVLEESEVHEIKQMLSAGMPHRAIGQAFDVGHNTIGKIAREETWKWLA